MLNPQAQNKDENKARHERLFAARQLKHRLMIIPPKTHRASGGMIKFLKQLISFFGSSFDF